MVLAIPLSVVLLVFFITSLSLIAVGIGLFTTPLVVDAMRAHADLRRDLARRWSGVTIPAAYRPEPAGTHSGPARQVDRTMALLKDEATWRDAGWLLCDAVAGFTIAVLPLGLIGYFLFGIVLLCGVWVPIHSAGGTFWYTFVPIDSWFTAVLAAVVGVGFLLLALRFNPQLIRGHFLMTGALNGASEKQQLARRVARLQETRHDALDNSAAELRRIERDLHDGAQARLVAMGMSLGAVEALIEKDPAQARTLLAQARANSAEALTELRDLVRGIHPPVLAERGLGDAARALALRMQLPVEVDVDLDVRLEEAVESAAYFAISEVLTNAAKHSGADQVWLDIVYDRSVGALRVAITDNGRGGADLMAGSGLRGLERRLGAFDGLLALSSPEGGPTMVTIEIPAAPAGPGGRSR
ncbi:sensor domain-containing protein [Streptomyces sp. RFCAC02]|uniref:sensor histidine kinase n=1 Tax=Streptomyces sp. RFCAC02 TaxID=2499143 RepID=UPI001F118099|nr:sensor domain-containing protein [Streptomyces sp. RFCAC02]